VKLRNGFSKRAATKNHGGQTVQQKWKKPNALKHGVYSDLPIIRGEDPSEFKELLRELTDEWQPEGPTEKDAVLSITKAMWLKRRAMRFSEIQSFKDSLDPNHVAYDEGRALLFLISCVAHEPETVFKKFGRMLRPITMSHLQTKVPRTNFKSTEEWAMAVVNEITDVLLPKHKVDHPEGQRVFQMMDSAAIFSGELFDRELARDERIGAVIDRAVKRLVQTKAMKEMLALPRKKPHGDVVKLPMRKIGS
jgi:hypothetical protein